MILCHVRTHANSTREFHAKLDLQKETCTIVLGDQVTVLDLKHKSLRNTYGTEALALIVGLIDNSELSVYVYKLSEISQLKNYRENYNYPRNLLLAHIPKNTTSWLDSNIKVVTRENTNNLDQSFNYVQIFHNELGSNPSKEQIAPVIDFCLNGANPWAKGYLFSEEIIVDVKEIR